MSAYDVIVIGSGAGGGTLVHQLAPSGKRILRLERGDWLPREPQNWSTADVFMHNRYISADTWYDADTAKAFQPQVHYFVGGATKLYGAALYRLRAEDFGELHHHDGISPAWPIGYDEMEPYYSRAEILYLGGQVGRRLEVLIKWLGARFGERQSALIEGDLASVERAPVTPEAAQWTSTSSR